LLIVGVPDGEEELFVVTDVVGGVWLGVGLWFGKKDGRKGESKEKVRNSL
jgi:hypothetical protein